MNFKVNNHIISFDDQITVVRVGNRIARVVIIEVLENSTHKEIMKKVKNVVNLDDEIFDLLAEFNK